MPAAVTCRACGAPSLTPLGTSDRDGIWRFRDANGRIWTVQCKQLGEPGYDPQVDDASCGKCGRNLSPLDLPSEHSPGCKGSIVPAAADMIPCEHSAILAKVRQLIVDALGEFERVPDEVAVAIESALTSPPVARLSTRTRRAR